MKYRYIFLISLAVLICLPGFRTNNNSNKNRDSGLSVLTEKYRKLVEL